MTDVVIDPENLKYLRKVKSSQQLARRALDEFIDLPRQELIPIAMGGWSPLFELHLRRRIENLLKDGALAKLAGACIDLWIASTLKDKIRPEIDGSDDALLDAKSEIVAELDSESSAARSTFDDARRAIADSETNRVNLQRLMYFLDAAERFSTVADPEEA